MKTKIGIVWMAVAVALLTADAVHARGRHVLAAGARYQKRHSQYTELPHANGDMTYLAGYEYHEAGGFWQILLGYTPDVSDGSDGRGIGVDAILTPQLNLLFEDRNWLAGVGVLASYIMSEDEAFEDDWTDIYWQVMIGYQLPIPMLPIELMVYYPFENWDTFEEFDSDDLEYGILLKYPF